jgi:hypothetical protein
MCAVLRGQKIKVWRASKAGMVSVAYKVQCGIAQARERGEFAFSGIRADENRYPTTGIKVGFWDGGSRSADFQKIAGSIIPN